MRGFSTLFIVSLLLAFLHSCTHDNGILKPACLIFEVDLNEKWWYPQDHDFKPIYFRSNGLLKTEGQPDSLSFSLQNCNKLIITDLVADTEEQWVIKSITDTDLQLKYPNEKIVVYLRKK